MASLVSPTSGLPQPEQALTFRSETLERIVNQQLAIMSRQLDLLRNGSADSSSLRALTSAQNGYISQASNILNTLSTANAAVPSEQITFEANESEVSAFGPYKAIKKSLQENLTREQRKRLDELVDRYGKRTKESKRDTESHRPHLADPRSVTGFRLLWKELTYPIVVSRSSGCRTLGSRRQRICRPRQRVWLKPFWVRSSVRYKRRCGPTGDRG